MKILKLILSLPFRLLKWMFVIEQSHQDEYGYHNLINDHRSDIAAYYACEHMQEVHEKIRRFYHGDSQDDENLEQKAKTYSQTHCN